MNQDNRSKKFDPTAGGRTLLKILCGGFPTDKESDQQDLQNQQDRMIDLLRLSLSGGDMPRRGRSLAK